MLYVILCISYSLNDLNLTINNFNTFVFKEQNALLYGEKENENEKENDICVCILLSIC